ncbi:hypothetical protein SAMN05660776_3183 [Salegentibacter holothuriorum]|uniref:Uncharacterized protein n=1 Tax=Salegentibacter holothuriorum TaxID=241145 RepID=A0A1T5EFL2_9FLAO|nr:hypothetical protein SAMN05660776_3183 [Salegentibacter holothuriorum]
MLEIAILTKLLFLGRNLKEKKQRPFEISNLRQAELVSASNILQIKTT